MPCDPFQMAMIHRSFRNEFGRISGLIRAVAAGDTERARIVESYCGNMLSLLHHHHAAEDELLWPKLRARAVNSDVDLMKVQHVRIENLIDVIQAVRPAWQNSADPAAAGQFVSAVDELCSGMVEHFDDEERNILPLIAEHITTKEWQAFIDRGAAYVNPRNLWFALAYAGFLLRDATPEEQRRFTGAVPLPLRVTLKLLGGSAFASYQKRLG